MDCSTPGFPVLHHLPEFAQIHVHWVSDAIQPSHPLSSLFSSCLPSFPASGSFPMSWLFLSDGQSIGASMYSPSRCAGLGKLLDFLLRPPWWHTTGEGTPKWQTTTFPRSGGWKSEIRGQEGCRLRPLMFACRRQPSPSPRVVFPWCLCLIPSYKDTSHVGLGSTLMTSFQCNYFLEDPICKILCECRGPGFATIEIWHNQINK